MPRTPELPYGWDDEELTPEEFEKFWKGHNFQDDCEWSDDPETKNYLTLAKAYLKLPGYIKTALTEVRNTNKRFYELLAFLATKPKRPIKVFSEGEEFKATSYPRGTIVRIARQMSRPGTPLGIEYMVLWGFIEQTRDLHRREPEDIIIGFPDGVVQSYWYNPRGTRQHLFNDCHTAFVVGEVIHNRERQVVREPLLRPLAETLKADIYSVPRNESLVKYSIVEIWQYGQGVRERVSEKAPSGTLQPQRLFGR